MRGLQGKTAIVTGGAAGIGTRHHATSLHRGRLGHVHRHER